MNNTTLFFVTFKSTLSYFPNKDTLIDQIGLKYNQKYTVALPFPNIVFKYLFTDKILDEVLREFPDFQK